MKKFKLFKRLGAFITAVAVLASMGTIAFADDAPQVAINNVNCVDPDNDGIYEVTVAYTVSGADVGSKGITLLAYGAKADAELKAGDDFTVYDSENYKIAYVLQATNAPGENGEVGESYTTVGAHTLSFNIDTNEENAIKVGEDEPILILLGGDKVVAPASALYPKAIVVSLKDSQGNEFDGFAAALDVNLDTTTIEAAVEEALAGYTLYIDDAATAFTVAVTESTEEGSTHKASLKVADEVVYEFDFNADLSWTAEALEISNTSYTIAKANVADADEDGIDVDDIIAAVKAKVLEQTIKVTKGELEAVIADAADAITVALNSENVDFDGAVANEAVKFDVTLADGTYGDATVAALDPVTVTVNYTLEAAPDVMYGDLNGDGFILANDVNMAFRASKGKVELTAEQMKAADVASATPDGLILANDVNYIFRASKNKLTNGKFPVEP